MTDMLHMFFRYDSSANNWLKMPSMLLLRII